MPSKVKAKNSAEISYPRLHINHKEAKKSSLTSRLTSCKSKTVTQTFCFPVRSVAAGSCRLVYKEVVEVQSNYKQFYFWWFWNPVCGDSTGSNWHFASVRLLANIFFSVCAACSANHFLTNIFTHNKLHRHVGLTCWHILSQFISLWTRFYHWFLVRYFSRWLIFKLIDSLIFSQKS